MKQLTLGQPKLLSEKEKVEWLLKAVAQIELYSRMEDANKVADAYVIEEFDAMTDPRRTFNPATVSLEQLAEVIATFIFDMKRRGVKRKQTR